MPEAIPGALVTTTNIHRENMTENHSGLKRQLGGPEGPPSMTVTCIFAFFFQTNACGSYLDPETAFRALVALCSNCLEKKAQSKHEPKDQTAARSQTVNIYFNPKTTALTWLIILFTDL